MTTTDMPIDRETQQIQRTAKTQERQQNQMERTLDQRLSNTSGCTPSTNIRIPHTSTNPVTLGELNSEFCYVEATSAKTTQKELPQDNTSRPAITPTPLVLIRKRISAPNVDRQAKETTDNTVDI